MKYILMIGGAILIALGLVWILQGVGVLPGSFMSGHMIWAYYGGVAAVVGIIAIFWGARRRSK